MTTNQTIDGVPLLPCPFCGGEPYGTHDHYVHDDLSPMPCVECRACSAHLKAEDWNRRAEPAAQPQGEPVAWMDPRSPEMHATISNEVKQHNLKFGGAPSAAVNGYSIPLYAEQPAPVAVVLPERLDLPHRDEFESADQYAAAIGETKKWNACLDEVTRLNAKSR